MDTTAKFSYVIQVKIPESYLRPEYWVTVERDLTMNNGAVTLGLYRAHSPNDEFRLIPTDWEDGIAHG